MTTQFKIQKSYAVIKCSTGEVEDYFFTLKEAKAEIAKLEGAKK